MDFLWLPRSSIRAYTKLEQIWGQSLISLVEIAISIILFRLHFFQQVELYVSILGRVDDVKVVIC
jgi:hypothetical protein